MAIKPISYYGKFTPTGVDQGFQQRMQALVGLSNQVGDTAFQIGAKQAQERGREEGLSVQRDEEGQLIAPEKRSSFTIAGDSYNKSSEMAYRLAIQTDAKKRLDELQLEYADDPDGFAQVASQYKKGAISGMPQNISAIAALDMESSIASRTSQLKTNFVKTKQQENLAVISDGLETLTDDVLNATRQGDSDRKNDLMLRLTAELDAAVDAGLDPIKARSIMETVRERIQEQSVLREIDNVVFNEKLSLEDQVIKGAEFVSDLRTRELKDLSPEQKDSLINVVSGKVAGLQKQLADQQSKLSIEDQKIVSDLKISAKNGLAPPDQIIERTELLHNQGMISGNERTSILNDVLSGTKESIKKSQDFAMVAKKLSGNSPEIVLDQKTVNDYYSEVYIPALNDMDPIQRAAAQSQFIYDTKMIPSGIKSEISNNILSGDPDLIAATANLIDRIDEVPGLVESVVSTNERAFTTQVVELSQSMEMTEAVDLARKLTDPRDKARIEAREQDIKDEDMRDDYESIIEDELEGFFTSSLATNINREAVVSDYARLFESFYKAGMSQDKAEAKATQIIKRNWKDSEFGFMKYPVEDYYAIAGDASYIRDQLYSEISKSNVGWNFSKKDIYLLSDKETARGASNNRPTYRVLLVDENGELQSPKGRFYPDIEKQQKKLEEESQKVGIEARERKAEYMKPVDFMKYGIFN